MNTEQLTTILETLKSAAGNAVWEQSIALLCSGSSAAASAAEHRTTAKTTKTTKTKGGAEAEQKPKRVLTEEHKAKMQAGRLAAKAAAAAAKAEVAEHEGIMATLTAVEPLLAGGSTAEPKRRGPKKLEEMTPEQRAAHDAKKAARKAAKAVSAAAAEAAPAEPAATAEPEVSTAAEAEAAAEKKRRGPKKLEEMSAEERAAHEAKKAARKAAKAAAAAAAPAPAAAELPDGEAIVVAGKTYIRLADGRCYEPGDSEEELGAFAGVMRGKVLDTTASEE